jgi:hypothetical protein
MKMCDGMDVTYPRFSEGEWSHSHPGRFIPGEGAAYLLDWRLGGHKAGLDDTKK